VAALVLWLAFWPTYEDVYFSVGAISVLIFWMLYFWAFVVISLAYVMSQVQRLKPSPLQQLLDDVARSIQSNDVNP
jgi:hypothetical protein